MQVLVLAGSSIQNKDLYTTKIDKSHNNTYHLDLCTQLHTEQGPIYLYNQGATYRTKIDISHSNS
jgi:hypothetical protein